MINIIRLKFTFKAETEVNVSMGKLHYFLPSLDLQFEHAAEQRFNERTIFLHKLVFSKPGERYKMYMNVVICIHIRLDRVCLNL